MSSVDISVIVPVFNRDGFISRCIRSLLNQSDIYVCSSNYESSPVSIWEAMSMELPIVSTDVGDLSKYKVCLMCFMAPRHSLISVFFYKRFLKKSVATLEDYDEWKERRRLFNPAFTQRFEFFVTINVPL